MGKLLRITDRVLIGLSIVGDVFESFEEISPTKQKWHQRAFGFFPTSYKKKSYYSTISRMLSNKLIEKVIVDGQAKIRISSTGKNKLTRDFPFLSFQNKKWDGKWRIVTFDIPVKKSVIRDRLRNKLKELGFGMLQQSIWISPHNFEDDIREFLVENNLGKNAYVFVSSKILVGDTNNIVSKLWNIDKINDLYKESIDKKSKDIYYQALSIDPFLPRELLPKKWYGDIAKVNAGA